jgi:Peptidase family M23
MRSIFVAIMIALALGGRIAAVVQAGASDQPYPGLSARTCRLSASELKDLPDIRRFLVEPSRQFLIDWQWWRTAGNTHIHLNLIGPGGQFQAPTIFHPDLARRFQATWGPQRALGDQPLPASFGSGLDEKEDPFSSGSIPVFRVSPLDLDQVRQIIPLGNLNPVGGHVFPTDHIYLDHGGQSKLTVRAPAAGTVTSIRDQQQGGLKIEIQVDKNISYYLAHLEREAGVEIGSQVSAGQELGRASGNSMLDLGATDARIRLTGFVNPDRYPQPTIHTISPLGLFVEPLRTQLYGKVRRNGADKDGKIDLDRPGRLVGNWFHQSLSGQDSSRGEAQVWAKQLSLGYDVHDSQLVRISIGGTIAPAGLYAVPLGAPDPAEVGVETGLVKYGLRRLGRSRIRSDADSGLLLVQLLNERQLKVEYFAEGSMAGVEGFTGNATIYER